VLTLSSTAQETRILGLGQNGLLTWTNTTVGGTCRIEWAPTVEGPWSDSWAGLANIEATDSVMSVPVPMFFRLVSTPPPEPIFTDLTAQAVYDLVVARQDDPDFVILDVRTASEHTSRHLVGALNIDFFSADFERDVDALDRQKAYLVYCASGNRSGQAMQVMQNLGFRELYNLLGGIGGFAAVPGADAYLEP